jgi:hypothetical protein
MAEETDVRTLRGIVQLNKACAHRFNQVKKLVKSLFDEREDCVPLPYFTPHGDSHSKAVESYLEQIIWGAGPLGPNDFVPTPEEAMYLLAAAWLHDIGMLYGIRDGEDPRHLQDPALVMRLRQEHEMRTVGYIHEVWKLECDWSPQEKTRLSNICAFHRRHRPIGTFELGTAPGIHDERPVRLVCLAALVRLADACDEDQSRTPGRLMALYTSLGMSQDAAVHWKKAMLIEKIAFNHAERKINVVAPCPPRFGFDIGCFDLSEIVDLVCHDIETELQSVQQVLLPYPNIYFGGVESKVYHPASKELSTDKQYLDMWPYLLNTPICSTEAAAALVQLLLLAVKEGEQCRSFGKTWQEGVFLPIMKKAQESRPLDFMIRNLCKRAASILTELPENASSASSLTDCLESFLNQIRQNYYSIAECAEKADIVGPQDVLILHGYSTNVAQFLARIGTRFKCSNCLYVVHHHEIIGKVQLGPDENTRVKDLIGRLGFKRAMFLELASTAQALDELRRRQVPCKVLLGTHGVLKSKDFLCKVGSHALASTAKEFGANIVAFAETTKFLTNGERDEDVANSDRLFSSKRSVRHPVMIDTMWLTPLIDVVPKELIDLVVTEKGVFPPHTLPIPQGGISESLTIEKMANTEEGS